MRLCRVATPSKPRQNMEIWIRNRVGVMRPDPSDDGKYFCNKQPMDQWYAEYKRDQIQKKMSQTTQGGFTNHTPHSVVSD